MKWKKGEEKLSLRNKRNKKFRRGTEKTFRKIFSKQKKRRSGSKRRKKRLSFSFGKVGKKGS